MFVSKIFGISNRYIDFLFICLQKRITTQAVIASQESDKTTLLPCQAKAAIQLPKQVARLGFWIARQTVPFLCAELLEKRDHQDIVSGQWKATEIEKAFVPSKLN